MPGTSLNMCINTFNSFHKLKVLDVSRDIECPQGCTDTNWIGEDVNQGFTEPIFYFILFLWGGRF